VVSVRCSWPRSATSAGSPTRGGCAAGRGLTTRHRESDTKVQRRHITKQGSRLVRWAAIEAISGANRQPQIASVEARVGARRGVNICRVDTARHLLTLVCHGLRDGEIRCLQPRAA